VELLVADKITPMYIFRLLAVSIAFIGLALPQAPAPKSHGATGATTATAAAKKPDLLDINSASKEDLDALPGIGSVYSQKIIDGRPYRAKTDLVNKKIIPQSTYNKIKDQIVARQKK